MNTCKITPRSYPNTSLSQVRVLRLAQQGGERRGAHTRWVLVAGEGLAKEPTRLEHQAQGGGGRLAAAPRSKRQRERARRGHEGPNGGTKRTGPFGQAPQKFLWASRRLNIRYCLYCLLVQAQRPIRPNLILCLNHAFFSHRQKSNLPFLTIAVVNFSSLIFKISFFNPLSF